ncbi:hypothetical protein V6N12_048821 [Hibiscus sabdariffa]|uniref:Uncharacterized protein n=1 Tax=Hibiscus sabdariffa TaxID=183260 RepID=A0ABR2EID3_9ROSI
MRSRFLVHGGKRPKKSLKVTLVFQVYFKGQTGVLEVNGGEQSSKVDEIPTKEEEQDPPLEALKDMSLEEREVSYPRELNYVKGGEILGDPSKGASSSSNPNGAKLNLTVIYGESFNDPNNPDAMENFKEFEHYRIRHRPQLSFLTSTAFNFRYLGKLREWKLMQYLRILGCYYHNLLLIFYFNTRCIFNETKEEIVSVESYLMGQTFQIIPKVINESLGIKDVGVADEGPQRHNPLGSVRDLDAHNHFLHLLNTWCFRPSGGKWSTIRNVDSFWMNCFQQNTRPNLSRIMFIEIMDLVRDRHLVSVKSFTYGTALSHIFEKLKIDCSANLAIPLTNPINNKSLMKAKFTLFGGQWVHNNELPQGVQPADAEDAPQAPILYLILLPLQKLSLLILL